MSAVPQEQRYEDIWDFFEPGQPLTPELIEKITQYVIGKELELKVRDQDYKSEFLDYLDDKLQLDAGQLELAEKQMEFQQGPYWDWYTTEYFDQMKKDSENKADISDNQLDQSANIAQSSYYQTKSSEAQLANQMSQYGPQNVRYAPTAKSTPGY